MPTPTPVSPLCARERRPPRAAAPTNRIRRTPTRQLLAAVLLLAGVGPAASAAAQDSAASSRTMRPLGTGGREQTADQQVRHVLDRLGFGARPGDVARVRAMGVDAYIDQQLHPERLADTAMSIFLAGFRALDMTGAQLIAQYPPPGQTLARLQRERGMQPGGTPSISREDSLALRRAAIEGRRLLGEVATARVARAVASERQLEEVLVDFWTNHFSVFAGKERVRYFIAEYEARAIRPHVLGHFRDLLGAVAKSPAMLYYLDNWQSVADSGRTTLVRRPQFAGGTRNAARGGGMRNRMAQRMTIGELIERDRLPDAAQRRLAALPPDVQDRLRGMTLAEAQETFAQAAQRRPRGLNENYARELLELHTLGVDGGYTQQDVIEVARAFTGWTIAGGPNAGGPGGGGFAFRADAHDAEAKTILGVAFPAGRGVEEGEAVLDLLARHPRTARHIAHKLAVRFVSDEPPATLVERAAEVFLRTDGDLREVVRAIVTSDEFFAAEAYRAKVKTPFELVVSAARALGGRPDATPRTAQLVAQLGQPVYGRQTPDGWPETGDAWINTGSILNRMNFGLVAGAGRLPGARLRDWPAARELTDASRETQVDIVIRELLGGAVSPDTRAVLVSGSNPLLDAAPAGADSIFAGDGGDAMGTDAGMRGGAMRGDAMRGDDPRTGGRAAQPAGRTLPPLTGPAQLVGLAIGAPEFQRR